MKVTYNWLQDYVDFPAEWTAQDVAEKLTNAGLEVEKVVELPDGDWLFDCEVTTNRPDWLGVIGVARELAALSGTSVKYPPAPIKRDGEPIENVLGIEVDDGVLCPRYTAQIIRGVKVTESPDWLKNRLEAIGLRPVNNVVDITNYVLFEYCQPLHAFDLDGLSSDRITVRRAKPGEKLAAINHEEYDLRYDHLVITDGNGPVALAGVMGGLASEVSESTTNILLESASFDFLSVRNTSRELGLASDSSYRFARFVDPAYSLAASDRAMSLIQELAGGTVAPGNIDVSVERPEPLRLSIRASEIRRILGIDIPIDDIVRIFTGLGLGVEKTTSQEVEALIPSFRQDLLREIDLIEEAGRIYGFDKVPRDMRLKVEVPLRDPFADFIETIHSKIIAGGFNEVITNSFIPERLTKYDNIWAASDSIRVRNPVRSDESALRRTLLTNLAGVKKLNADKGARYVDLYEIGTIFLNATEEIGGVEPDERLVAGLLSDGGYSKMKGVIDALLADSGLSGYVQIRKCPGSLFSPETGMKGVYNGRLVFRGGVLSDAAGKLFDMECRPAICEIDLAALFDEGKFERLYRPIMKTPPVLRDLAVIVDEEVKWQDISRAVELTGGEYLRSIDFFDVYRGEQIEQGRKSVAFSLTFQSGEKSLTSEDIDTHIAGIIAELDRSFKAVLRT